MKFEEPKVEFVKITSTEVVFASPTGGAGGVIGCTGGSASQCDVESLMIDDNK